MSKHPIMQECVASGESLEVIFMFVGLQSATSGKPTFDDVNNAMQKLITAMANKKEEKQP